MKKGKATFFTLTILLLLIGLLALYFNDNQELYGNDKDSIVKVIKSINGYENKSIEILEVKDFNDQRVVGFLSDNSPGYIQFRKNIDDNFVWSHVEVMDDETLSLFIPSHIRMFMFVANNENEIAKMQVSINGQIFEQKFLPYKATVAWVDFPETNKSKYEFRNYKYYDKEGNLIKEIN